MHPGRTLWSGIVVLTLAAATVALSAAAEPKAIKLAGVVQAVLDCRAVSETASRLACYDAAVGKLSAALTQGEVTVVEHAQVRALRRQAFGSSGPGPDLFGGVPKQESVDRITVDLSDAYRGPSGRWVLITTDGAVWKQTDDDPPPSAPHKGSKLAVRRAAFGSYFCNIDGQRAVRCERSR